MYNPESDLENKVHKMFYHFEIQTEHLISARRTDLVIDNNNNDKKKKEKNPAEQLTLPFRLTIG